MHKSFFSLPYLSWVWPRQAGLWSAWGNHWDSVAWLRWWSPFCPYLEKRIVINQSKFWFRSVLLSTGFPYFVYSSHTGLPTPVVLLILVRSSHFSSDKGENVDSSCLNQLTNLPREHFYFKHYWEANNQRLGNWSPKNTDHVATWKFHQQI